MSEFFKKQIKSIPFWLSAVTIVLSLLGIIFISVSNGVQGYAITSLPVIITCAVFAMVCVAGGIYLSYRFGAHHWSVVAINLIALVLLAVCFANVISSRAVLASSQFSYDSVNTVGWTVLYESIAALAFFLIGDILLVVSAFFKGDEKEAPAEE